MANDPASKQKFLREFADDFLRLPKATERGPSLQRFSDQAFYLPMGLTSYQKQPLSFPLRATHLVFPLRATHLVPVRGRAEEQR